MAKTKEKLTHSPRHCRDYLRALRDRSDGVPVDRMANMREARNVLNRDYLVDNGLCRFANINGEKRFVITDAGIKAFESGAPLAVEVESESESESESEAPPAEIASESPPVADTEMAEDPPG